MSFIVYMLFIILFVVVVCLLATNFTGDVEARCSPSAADSDQVAARNGLFQRCFLFIDVVVSVMCYFVG